MSELSLFRLNEKIDTNVSDLQAKINTKQDTIVEDATHRWFTDAERTKLQGIQALAEVNQVAFSNIKVGTDTIASSSKTDTFELASGTNINIRAVVANKKVIVELTGKVPSATYADTAGTAVAVGGDSDTVDGKHATDFAPIVHTHDNSTIDSIDWSKIINKPSSLPSSGGDADTVDGKHASSFAPIVHVHDSTTITSVEWNAILNKPDVPPANGKQLFTANGSFTVPNNISVIWVSATGGGGGGASDTNGNDGTATIFGTYITCNGGKGGLAPIGTNSICGHGGTSGGSFGGAGDISRGGSNTFGQGGINGQDGAGYGSGGGPGVRYTTDAPMFGGGGGSGDAVVSTRISVIPGRTISVTIGQGGTGATNAGRGANGFLLVEW